MENISIKKNGDNILSISGYGITLCRLTEDKIELVRRWRNESKISQYMVSRAYITAEMQKKWFLKINNHQNYYFLIVVRGKEVGLVNIRNISQNIEGESGIFIWDDDFLGKQISYRSLLALHDFAFNELHLQSIISYIFVDNVRSQKCYKSLGFVLDEGQQNLQLQKYTLSMSNHLISRLDVMDKLKIL